MDYTYTTTGGVLVGGCVPFEVNFFYITRFNIGSIVLSKKKKKKGIFEKIAIKDIRFSNKNAHPFGTSMKRYNYAPLYIDSYNGYHNEEDLCGYSEASALAEAYRIKYAAQLEKITRDNC